jgi:cation diffusion facilitator CzcD-associated flavoprotein CzcO
MASAAQKCRGAGLVLPQIRRHLPCLLASPTPPLAPFSFPGAFPDDPVTAIIGGGLSGLACAQELAKRGLRSVVFDTGADAELAGVQACRLPLSPAAHQRSALRYQDLQPSQPHPTCPMQASTAWAAGWPPAPRPTAA